MTTRTKLWTTFAGILLLALVAGAIDYPKIPDLNLGSYSKALNLKLGLDLKGGTSLLYDADVNSIASEDQESAVGSVRDVIERRVNSLGVSEPIVQTSKEGENWRIRVELAGVTDVKEAIELIGETPTLEFREEAEPIPLTEEEKKLASEENAAVRELAQSILDRAKAGEDFAELANTYSEDPGNFDPETGAGLGGDLGFNRQGSFVPEFDTMLFTTLKDGELSQELVQTQFGFHIIKRIEEQSFEENGEQITQVRGAHILLRTKSTENKISDPYTPTALSGKQLRRATVQFDQTTNEPQVLLEFNSEGSQLFAEITKKNIGKTVAIYLDGYPISTPMVNEEIPSGQAVISGGFTLDEAKELAKRLNAGALPVPVELVNQQTIAASLGEQSIYRSLFAGIAGFALVAIFMIVYYRLPGLLSVGALVIYVLVILAIFKIIPVTLTLAGIAGFILSVGIAVDANILIFERTKEELRSGAPLLRAIETGFDRAWPSIRDSNISSIITSLILYLVGSSFIKGFALTLIIGIVVSMFSAITITRSFLRLTASEWLEKRLHFIARIISNKEITK